MRQVLRNRVGLHSVGQGLRLLVLAWGVLFGLDACAAVWRVGPRELVRSVAQAAKLARDGDVVEIIAGEYPGDVAVWTQRQLTIRGIGGRPKLLAQGRSAEGKAIWVIRGGQILVENVAFIGARVPHRNGAGIRLEGGQLTVRDCLFDNNEMGILTANFESIQLVVENSEFSHGVNVLPRFSHLLYAGQIGRLEVRGSYFHHGMVGHLLKSRARFNLLEFNRLTDEAGGEASYEVEFPEGGIAILVGNLIGQSATTRNNRMIAYGAEGLRYPDNVLVLASNTLMDQLPLGGEFLGVWSPDRVRVAAYNNLLLGGCTAALDCAEGALRRGWHRFRNLQLPWDAEERFPAAQGNVAVLDQGLIAQALAGRWPETVHLPGQSVLPSSMFGVSLVPRETYVYPVGRRLRDEKEGQTGRPTQPGAL